MAEPDLNPSSPSSTPSAIGRYVLERRLGSGGFATVWLAHDTSLDAPVAVKILAENWADRLDLRERFLREAQLLRRAASPRVVQVFDIGELPDGRPYFVMSYADRGTLEDRISGAPLPLPTALPLITEVARAVADLHRGGVVHRDVKPSNVLIASSPCGDDRLLLADLGVAKSLAQASGLTMSVGSAGYQAPEQAEPNVGVDVRADVYGLGALAYRLLTGTVPGAPGTVVPLSRLRPDLPAPAGAAVMRALSPDREDRFPSAEAFAEALSSAGGAGAAPSPGTTPPPVAAAGRTGGSRRRLLRWLVVVLLVAGVGGGAWWEVWGRNADGVVVRDVTQRISVRVPRGWAAATVPGGWDPAVLGLPAHTGPGLLATTDVDRWDDLRSDVNGVFVGVGDDDLPAAVARITHPGCRAGSQQEYRSARWTGDVRRWDACTGDSRSVEEIALRPTAATGEAGVAVYVQIRQTGQGPDETRAVLGHLRAR